MLGEEEVFEPWIGSNYASGGILSKKMLIVGASHYCDNCYFSDECGGPCEECREECPCPCTNPCGCGCSQLTKYVIERYLSPNDAHAGWKNTYTRFVNAVMRISSGDFHAKLPDKTAFFNSVAYTNYLQMIEGENDEDKHPELYDQYAKKNLLNFKNILHDLRPEVVVVWGENARSHIPTDLGFGEALVDEVNHSVRHYKFEDFTFCFFACAHPSSCKFIAMKPSATEVLRSLDVAVDIGCYKEEQS